jgi:diadenosine tetraphosphatase ApaH/serine/threonine PP2A family protein phosphatase
MQNANDDGRIQLVKDSAICILQSALKWWVATVLPRALSRFRIGTVSQHNLATRRDTKAELNRRGQACEVLIDTGISRRVEWSSMRVTLFLLRFGRPACISQHLCSKQIGVPCEICTHVRGFADRCLCYSANGTFGRPSLRTFTRAIAARQTAKLHQLCVPGDFVGYCADPKACVDIVRGMKAPCVKGNNDEYCAADGPLDGFNPKAAKAVEWSRNQLTADDRQWLRELPYVLNLQNFTLVHATLNGPEKWGYVFDRLAAASSLACQKADLCFFGHTHVPVAFVRDTMVRGGTFTKLMLERGKQYFVNGGSVGQPRDNNPKAAYVTYNLKDSAIELHRVAYDIDTAKKKIREAGLF